MIKGKKVLGVILARIGSKGVKQKNIREVCGHPLISYSIYAGLKSRYIDELVVSTDSKKIAKISENYGAKVPFLRPKKLALDHIWSRDALKHAVLKAEERKEMILSGILIIGFLLTVLGSGGAYLWHSGFIKF